MADPDLQIRVGGGGVVGIPDPEKKAGGPGLPKKFFSPFGPHFARKIRGGGGQAAPEPPRNEY